MTTPSTRVRTRLARFAATVLAGALLALGSTIGLAPPAVGAHHAVVIEQYAYSPASLTISQGDSVTWTNQDSVEHDVTVTRGPVAFHSPMLAKGQSWSHTFTTAGTYSYICSVHPDMVGSVTATAAPVTASAPRVHATHRAHAAATAAAPAPSTGPKTHNAGSTPRAAAPPASQAAAPAETQALAATVEGSPATLDPLLLVAGASTAVTVFCLLLMTSRPARATDTAPESSAGEEQPEPRVTG